MPENKKLEGCHICRARRISIEVRTLAPEASYCFTDKLPGGLRFCPGCGRDLREENGKH